MSYEVEIRCDERSCSSVKQQTNHWWIWREAHDPKAFLAVPMQGAANERGDRHLCSSACLHRVMEEWVQSHTDVTVLEHPKDASVSLLA